MMKASEEHLQFLDDLRDSGITNMFGGAKYLREESPELSEEESREILVDWMKSFGERHK